MKGVIAFFDLDGTITKKDTFIDFIIFVRGYFFFFLGLLVLSPFIVLFKLKLFPNYRLKELFFKFYLSKFDADELEKKGKYYALNRIPEITYKDALNRINWHKTNNHRVIVLTASSGLWIFDWCDVNQLELIGTNFEKVGGRYSGKIKGKNCFGQEKLRIVNAIVQDSSDLITYGYGDSEADKYFLDVMTHSVYKPDWTQKK